MKMKPKYIAESNRGGLTLDRIYTMVRLTDDGMIVMENPIGARLMVHVLAVDIRKVS